MERKRRLIADPFAELAPHLLGRAQRHHLRMIAGAASPAKDQESLTNVTG
jgi:hypothetical protein